MRSRALALAVLVTVAVFAAVEARAQPAAPAPKPAPLTLGRLVDPATRVEIDGRTITLAIHALIRFDTLSDLFAYIDTEAGRWTFATAAERQAFADDLLRRGVESRIVSMETERPLEVLLTHTRAELDAAVNALAPTDDAVIHQGTSWRLTRRVYREAFARVRDRWSTSLNCWSASSSMAGRVLSNWYLIDEGITLYGAVYDSTEHFWQAVKYRPDVTVADLRTLLAMMTNVDWTAWLAMLERDQAFALANGYSRAFLRVNLAPAKLREFAQQLHAAATPDEPARTAQQRVGRGPGAPVRFTALEEKVLWGDLADVFHLVVVFSGRLGPALPPDAARVRDALVARGFDAIHLPGYAGGRFGFMSPEFQNLMLEIWKVKYLAMPRFREVIRGTVGRRLDHFLDDGDSPDIPIPIYVHQLNTIRDLALQGR